MTKNKSIIPVIIALIGAVMMVATLFLPYASATAEHAENLNKSPDTVVYEELDMTAKDVIHMSMVDYTNLYCNMGEELLGNSASSIMYVVLVALLGGFSLLAAIFSIVKKPIAIIIFDALAFAVFYVQRWDYLDRGVIPNSYYNWGIASPVFYIAAGVVIAGAVWMLIQKIAQKKNDQQ